MRASRSQTVNLLMLIFVPALVVGACFERDDDAKQPRRVLLCDYVAISAHTRTKENTDSIYQAPKGGFITLEILSTTYGVESPVGSLVTLVPDLGSRTSVIHSYHSYSTGHYEANCIFPDPKPVRP